MAALTRLALMWHMHQPYYEDLATGEHVLPWVRLHALKDYWGMVALVGEFPGVQLTFNLVPSLLVQIEAFAADRAHDRHLLIGLKPADILETHERDFLVGHGFHAPFDRMIRPYPRYAELHGLRAGRAPFSVDDLRDLQVWHKLAWMDPDWLITDARLVALVARGRDFCEADKATLREVELELLGAVIPAYRRAAATGQVELSTSPFYHPILPLLCDTEVHRRAHPGSALPRHLFAHPDDARQQVERAVAFHTSRFVLPPRGVWPSEGSVSDEVVDLLASSGIEWAATDEDILMRSLQRALTPADLYRPYLAERGEGQLRLLFRDHRLSDAIGFTYQSWGAEAAADDFLHKVRDAGRRFAHETNDGEAVVTVILDGENAWEHYAGGGRAFLRALYRRLEAASDIQTVTMSAAALRPARALPSVFPGSWINGDFYIWAGHRDDHRAWGQLARARETFDRVADGMPPDARERAREELLVAEGSDWFWWYGDDHSSDHDRDFDDLFRRHLRNVYRVLGLPPPDDLYVTNISTQAATAGPVSFSSLTAIDPSADGNAVSWLRAVDIPLAAESGSMHRVTSPLLRQLRLAADRQTLFLRLDGEDLARRVDTGLASLELLVDGPRQLRVTVTQSSSGRSRYLADRSVIVAVPFATLHAQACDRIRLSVLITASDGQPVEQHPAQPIEIEIPSRHTASIHWVV